MNFVDKLKFSLHNIWNSKSRSALTVVIVFIVSLLILVISISCITVSENANRLSVEYFEKNGSSLRIMAKQNIYDSSNIDKPYISPIISKEDFTVIQDTLKKSITSDNLYASINGNIYAPTDRYSVNLSNLYAFDYNFGGVSSSDFQLISGRTWNSQDSNTSGIYVSETFLNNYYARTNILLVPDDTLSLNYTIYGDKTSTTESFEATILGVTKFTVNNTNEFQYNNPRIDCIIDMAYLYNNLPSMYPSYMNSDYTAPNVAFDINAIIKDMKATENTLNTTLEPNPDGKGKRVYGSLVEELNYSTIITLVIVGLGAVLSFIVLLLSIGSVANTIMISIDKNRRFTGLMMAMGLKHKNVKTIVRLESIITICTGVLLATLLCYCFTPIFQSVLGGLFMSMFYNAAEIGFMFKFTLPIYLPIIVAVVFILMAILFSKTGIRKLGKMDVITVISEVG